MYKNRNPPLPIRFFLLYNLNSILYPNLKLYQCRMYTKILRQGWGERSLEKFFFFFFLNITMFCDFKSNNLFISPYLNQLLSLP